MGQGGTLTGARASTPGAVGPLGACREAPRERRPSASNPTTCRGSPYK